MKAYELLAIGDSLCGHRFTMRSKEIYLCEVKANSAIPAFIDKCCDPKYLNAAERDTLKIIVAPREIIE
jgi:hypothetical protein